MGEKIFDFFPIGFKGEYYPDKRSDNELNNKTSCSRIKIGIGFLYDDKMKNEEQYKCFYQISGISHHGC